MTEAVTPDVPVADDAVETNPDGMVYMRLPGSEGVATTTPDSFTNYWKARGFELVPANEVNTTAPASPSEPVEAQVDPAVAPAVEQAPVEAQPVEADPNPAVEQQVVGPQVYAFTGDDENPTGEAGASVDGWKVADVVSPDGRTLYEHTAVDVPVDETVWPLYVGPTVPKTDAESASGPDQGAADLGADASGDSATPKTRVKRTSG